MKLIINSGRTKTKIRKIVKEAQVERGLNKWWGKNDACWVERRDAVLAKGNEEIKEEEAF